MTHLDRIRLRRVAEIVADLGNLPDALADAAAQSFMDEVTPAVVIELLNQTKVPGLLDEDAEELLTHTTLDCSNRVVKAFIHPSEGVRNALAALFDMASDDDLSGLRDQVVNLAAAVRAHLHEIAGASVLGEGVGAATVNVPSEAGRDAGEGESAQTVVDEPTAPPLVGQPSPATSVAEEPIPTPADVRIAPIAPVDDSIFRQPEGTYRVSPGVYGPILPRGAAQVDGVEFTLGAVEKAKKTGLDLESLAAVVTEGSPRPGDRGGQTLFQRGDQVVAVNADGLVSTFFTARDSVPGTGRSGPSGGQRRLRFSNTRELLAAAGALGFEYELDGQDHYRLTHPSVPGPSYPVPKTPSDHRSLLNATADIRRIFGIDVATPTNGVA